MNKTHGFQRKADVPADGGNVKVCPKCDLWYSAKPKQRVCDGCRPNKSKALRASENQGDLPIPGSPGNSQSSHHNGGSKAVLGVRICRELALDAARHADLGNKSWAVCNGACSEGCSCTCHEEEEDVDG